MKLNEENIKKKLLRFDKQEFEQIEILAELDHLNSSHYIFRILRTELQKPENQQKIKEYLDKKTQNYQVEQINQEQKPVITN